MRRLTKKDVEAILARRFAEGFLKLSSLPQPQSLKDITKAAQRIKRAVDGRERIAIVGDYDVDGVVSTALMEEFFDYLGYPVTTIIPNRFKHGYGLSPKVIEELGDVDLIITVDNGISALQAARLCQERGIDLIITDHHTPGAELPQAYAIVNPKQQGCGFEYSEICGAQVAWFLIGELKRVFGLDLDMRAFLDLLVLAIIADVMPLRHINRPLVQAGLKAFGQSQRPAIRYLRAVLKKEAISSEDVGFGVAPLLNSAGRMEDASLALEFLRAPDFMSAQILHERLSLLNARRKAQERKVFEEALAFVKDDDPIILCAGDDWSEGVVGIVAARLTDRFKKPSIVLTKSKDLLKGSGRSLGDVDLFALLQESSHFLEGFGGHKKAAGLSLYPKNLPLFRRSIQEAASQIPKEAFLDDEGVLGELPLSEVDWELMEILERFAPYGESNPSPKFAARSVEVLEWRMVGQKEEHLLMTLREGNKIFKGIWFRSPLEPAKNFVDIVYQPIKNIYRNEINIQLYISKIV
ncbi:MAG: single-stranded-DNA-specific exonuclease RecJ [Epsilonproteobacteria bacterium]|nr:single-stranded-DNA-specific exonuclease RecJ [Campylobacterota bacterium]NPA64069.1 single-stranded-DNA-specific exonuclease RecJ [Campylobacterota bacterium]